MYLPLKSTDVFGLSVVIVTLNGSKRLVPTLEYLANQQELDFPCELIIIDNGSDDDTIIEAKSIWLNFGAPYNLRILSEPKKGTMYAREKGIQQAQFRYLLFCDDDNWLCNTYLKSSLTIISSSPEIAAVGGIGKIKYEDDFNPPSWMTESIERRLGTGPQGSFDGDITSFKGSLYTAGAALDRKWLNALYAQGFKSILKGRDGRSLVAGEDTLLTIALKKIGGKLYYSSEMTFFHYIPSSRTEWEYLKNLWFAFGQSDLVLSPITIQSFWNKNTSFLINYLKECLKLIVEYFPYVFLVDVEGRRSILERRHLEGKIHALIFKFKIYKRVKSMQFRRIKIIDEQ